MLHWIESKKNVFLVALWIILIFVFALINNKKLLNKPLRFAYGNDLASAIIAKIKEEYIGEKDNTEYSFFSIGDCCGSTSQFAFASGEVDVAVICPDMYKELKKLNKNYVIAGELLYDSEVLIYLGDFDSINLIGFMNKRKEQEDILNDYFNNKKKCVPIIPSGLSYALYSGVIDAAYVDVISFLKLDAKAKLITNNICSNVLVVRKDLVNDIRFIDFAEKYNSAIDKINSDEKNLYSFIDELIGGDNKEELINKWKQLRVRFGCINKIF